MSQEDVEIVKRAMDGFNRTRAFMGAGDPLPWMREFLDPRIEMDLSRRGINPEIYHGHEGYLRLRAQDAEAWTEARFEVEEVIDAGDMVVLFTHSTGLARSGLRLGVHVGHLLTLSGGKIVRWEFFGEDRSACLRAAGLEI